LQHLCFIHPVTARPFIAPAKSSLTSSNTLGSLKWVAALTMARGALFGYEPGEGHAP